MFMQRGAVSAAFRSIPFRILTFEELGLPAIVAELLSSRTGWCSSPGRRIGQDHDARVDHRQDQQRDARSHHDDRNSDRRPSSHKLSIVNQREVGSDTSTFKTALKYVLRQDPTSFSSERCAISRPSRPL